MEADENVPTPITLVQNALRANKDHQHLLKVYTEALEAELKELDELLVHILLLEFSIP
jgi:hypothetical protein